MPSLSQQAYQGLLSLSLSTIRRATLTVPVRFQSTTSAYARTCTQFIFLPPRCRQIESFLHRSHIFIHTSCAHTIDDITFRHQAAWVICVLFGMLFFSPSFSLVRSVSYRMSRAQRTSDSMGSILDSPLADGGEGLLPFSCDTDERQ